MSVTYDSSNGIARIELARQDSMNAMDRAMYAGVNDAFRQFNDDDDAGVAIFSSANAEAFCAGVDIKDVHRALTEEGLSLEALGEQLSVFFEEPGQFGKPVIAAIHGHCVGEGMVMSLFCDMRIASSDAVFSLPEARVGVPSINGTIRAIQLAGHGAAMELLLTGEARDAAWAHQHRFVNRVVERDQLLPTAESLARSILESDASALRIMRQIGDRALEARFKDLVGYGLELRASIETKRMVERQQAFVDRSGKQNGKDAEGD
jgi:enoyl-CoA hydratase/carnithine racemase